MSTSLYQRLGERSGIARIVDDVVAFHLANPVIKTRFEHAKDLENLKQKACEFFCAGSGGPETYSGKEMRAAHLGMNITEQEYLAVMDDVAAALDKTASTLNRART
ncbi:group I truncated hemoglobin [Chitinibacteraceae bacterium HSL-7]